MPRYATVVFDCDSTLSSIEGIEELAHEHRGEVAVLTDAAMRGEISLEEVYARRLALVQPDRARVEALGRRYIETLVPDALETVAALHREGIEVRILSGGLLPPILDLARVLGIAEERVAAVDLHFDGNGAYAGFDAGCPLAYSGGKRVVLERWAGAMPRPILMVGDGITDLEAKPVVDGFAAYTGVVARPAVVSGADHVVRSASLAPVLVLALDGQPPRDSASRTLFEKGVHLMDTTDATPSGDR